MVLREKSQNPLGVGLNTNPLWALEKTTFCFHERAFSLEMGMLKLPRAVLKRFEGPERGKEDLVDLIDCLLSESILQFFFFNYIFLTEKSRKQGHPRPYFFFP